MAGLPALLLLLLTCRLQLLTGAPTAPSGAPQEDQSLEIIQESAEWRAVPKDSPSLGTQPEVEPPFILDLQSLSSLSPTNPNIQVTIEVDGGSQAEVELDLSDTRTDWTDPEWVSQHELFWPLFWEYVDAPGGEIPTPGPSEPEGGDYSSEWEDNVLSGRDPAGDNWLSEDRYDYEDDEWSPWSSCSATCGHAPQKRTRACGYSCTATESRACDLPPCPGEEPTENSTQWWTSTPTPESAHLDSCDRWLTCKSEFLSNYLHRVLTELPSCPCSYPSEAVYSSVVLRDEQLGRSFRWRDASGARERLDIYNVGARFCLRSLLGRDSGILGAQHCCYDHSLQLVTRGRAAGTPALISADFSPELHYKADVLPWILCKGDWSRIHALRPPNNGRGCPQNPPEKEYLAQLQEAGEF
ncbi:LOW QUALITY PROTEIN: isthmin-2 [Gastrophryne carolinensis]